MKGIKPMELSGHVVGTEQKALKISVMAAISGTVGCAGYEVQLRVNFLLILQLGLCIDGLEIGENVDMYKRMQHFALKCCILFTVYISYRSKNT
jgi:hypothetical protein